ncbi:MAG: endonuclease III [Deferrisomatales bacterium]
METADPEARRLRAVLRLLRESGLEPRPGLHHSSAWQLLVATVLSAQCTDARVNQVAPRLFARYPSARALARAELGEVEETIRSIGIFRNKARHLVALAGIVAERHGGKVPRDRAALEALPGVGRKTASVVLGQAFGIAAFPVDTHVGRVCHRLGFSPSPRPEPVEARVTRLLDPGEWMDAHLLLIRHGRRTCTARNPKCPACPVRRLCRWPHKG